MTGRRRSKAWIYWVVVLALLFAAFLVGYKVWEEYFKEDITSSGEESKEEPDEQKKDDTSGDEKSEETEITVEEETIKKVEQYDGGDPNAGGGLTGVVTYAGVSGESLMIRVNIDQYLAGGGCKLELSSGDNIIYSETSEIIDSASTATCKGFNVPVSGLSKGTLSINILLTAGEKTGIIKGEVSL